ncbi:Retrovirus-related Pol polyprotein from transposon RE1 [Vitis vinifera]|uniref:Retrovirus-related Pol polyprotein from transposon RE1 n=1 Tax=Vitis vinifera TaxID=29760 RepID=A0A438FR19_VITVI|nr:Retrovirus-related Pol polyprotein from transposon RE1 [Vitis vinifera]
MFGVDFSETFAPVARLDTIRMLLALAAQKGWNIHQMDVKSAFLNGYLEEEIFVEQPEGFIVKGMEEKVYLLKKALYGLKQAPRAWKVCDETLVVSLYVDDLLVTGSSMKQIDNFKKEMKDVFEMTDLGRMTFFLGMESAIPSGNSNESNEKFCKKDGAAKADERLYRTIIGCLMYLTATRPDIMNADAKLQQPVCLHYASSCVGNIENNSRKIPSPCLKSTPLNIVILLSPKQSVASDDVAEEGMRGVGKEWKWSRRDAPLFLSSAFVIRVLPQTSEAESSHKQRTSQLQPSTNPLQFQ